MAQGSTSRTVVLEKKETLADGVVRLTLRNPDRTNFPQWQPGSHIDLVLPGFIRQYSLCSPCADPSMLQVCVLHTPESRGGSQYVHESLPEGTEFTINGPRNNFPLQDSRKYLFIAGGIGITPILPMIEAAEAAGREWRLAYGGRSRASMAFADELEARYGSEKVLLYPADTHGRIDLQGLLGLPRAKMLVYACGPAPLLNAIEDFCMGWPPGALHTELFSAAALDGSGASAEPFELDLRNSGLRLEVPVDKTVLEVVEEAGIRVLSSCRQGVCGTCEIRVAAGEVDHRDAVLSAEDKASGETMLVCVSRAAAGCSTLALDL
ncbi:oxidoreductase [Arthrobacter sp. Sa2CUA1]|uniref:Oxidoreductase n=1 Tax=Arthrobacter gallicola TaxID=2762225 RepID=A0ABR8UV96_9MICC|nr:PDR/VanB family oxidoreductase [Arthrobacter gallicola]MBD7996485.1 oxidoreductase [Arthrobacter gallicola]